MADSEDDHKSTRDKFRKERNYSLEKKSRKGAREQSQRERIEKYVYRDYSPRKRKASPEPAEPEPPLKKVKMKVQPTVLTQPQMMTIKQFAAARGEEVTDQDTFKKYKTYKQEFEREQMNEFFREHKDEEWLRQKYHPVSSVRKKRELATGIKYRLNTFMDLYGKGFVNQVRLDHESSQQIIRFLDAVVIKLEGGSDFDLQALDEPEETEKGTVLIPSSLEHFVPNGGEDSIKKLKIKKEMKKKKKRKKSSDSDSDDKNSVSSDSGSEKGECKSTSSSDSESERSRSGSSSSSDTEDEKDKGSVHSNSESSKSQVCPPESKTVSNVLNDTDAEDTKVNIDIRKPAHLHRIRSIFLRHLEPHITKQKIKGVCKRFPGFLRVAIADPQPEWQLVRRAWITFDNAANIEDICNSLNEDLQDRELGAVVNSNTFRRIRSVSGIAAHKQVVLFDIKLASRIIQNYDRRRQLWGEKEEDLKKEISRRGFQIVSKNPLLKNITDYLIEEASAEEEELLGRSIANEQTTNLHGLILERDETLIQVLDRLLLYLRVVHSLDYYNSSEYPSENDMPNRCGIMHVRGSPPSSRVTQREINEYISFFERKSQIFLYYPEREERAYRKAKDMEYPKDKMINSVIIQQLAVDKWTCVLCTKKFKGAEFVKKHIFKKHGEEEIEYYRNYFIDRRRPKLPVHPANRRHTGFVNKSNLNINNAAAQPYNDYLPPPPHAFHPLGQGGWGPNPYGAYDYPFYDERAYSWDPEMHRSDYPFRNYPRQYLPAIGSVMYRDLDAPY